MLGVPLSQLLGDEQLDGLANQLRAGVAEKILGLRIDEDNDPVLIDDHHAVGS